MRWQANAANGLLRSSRARDVTCPVSRLCLTLNPTAGVVHHTMPSVSVSGGIDASVQSGPTEGIRVERLKGYKKRGPSLLRFTLHMPGSVDPAKVDQLTLNSTFRNVTQQMRRPCDT